MMVYTSDHLPKLHVILTKM